MKTTALLLMDLQRDFLEADGRMPVSAEDAQNLVETANRMIIHAINHGWAIICVKNQFKQSDLIGNFFRRYAALEGSSGAEIDPRITVPPSSVIISKTHPSAFSNPECAEFIHSSSIEELVVLGLMAEGCVRTTVKDALKRRLSVIVVSDGIASTREFLKRFGIKSMAQAGAQLIQSKQLLCE